MSKQGSNTHALIGQFGEFTDGQCRVTQCRVTSVNEKERWLRITYFNRESGRTIKDAEIGISDFRKTGKKPGKK